MSVAVRRGLYGKLAGDTTLTNMLAASPTGYSKSIFYQQAPAGAQYPYLIFSKQASTPSYGMKLPQIDNDIWMVKAVTRDLKPGDTADAADNISSRVATLLTDAALSISGKTHNYLRRESDIDYAEVADGVVYRHSGSYFRVTYQ